ncbi:SdpI family protein [Streptococcus sp. 263_SSPC]|uniref:SdpI family protein n=1 Tax=Streptococcus sp. 263_SSPC TaxID=1579343 RepID=UPI000660FF1A|nr:SdpI family protein [Streptococcus sp. 263_SSPC]
MEQVKQFKKYAYLALMFAPLVVSLFVVWFLPETIVSRMDIAGNVTATASRFSIFLFPILVAILGFGIRVASSSPKLTGGNVRTARSISWILLLLLNVIAYFQFWLYLGGMTVGAQMSRFLTFILGVFFILVGNLAPKIKENSKHFGFRASWLKNNDVAFRKTQRFFGIASVVAGILMMLTGIFMGNNVAILVATMIMIILIAVTGGYSYYIANVEEV